MTNRRFEGREGEEVDRDDRPLADRRSAQSPPVSGEEVGEEHEPSETDPAATPPQENEGDEKPEWPTRA